MKKKWDFFRYTASTVEKWLQPFSLSRSLSLSRLHRAVKASKYKQKYKKTRKIISNHFVLESLFEVSFILLYGFFFFLFLVKQHFSPLSYTVCSTKGRLIDFFQFLSCKDAIRTCISGMWDLFSDPHRIKGGASCWGVNIWGRQLAREQSWTWGVVRDLKGRRCISQNSPIHGVFTSSHIARSHSCQRWQRGLERPSAFSFACVLVFSKFFLATASPFTFGRWCRSEWQLWPALSHKGQARILFGVSDCWVASEDKRTWKEQTEGS